MKGRVENAPCIVVERICIKVYHLETYLTLGTFLVFNLKYAAVVWSCPDLLEFCCVLLLIMMSRES